MQNAANIHAPSVACNVTVAAYITAYQDGPAVQRCIAALRAQSVPVQRVLVVDNSPVPVSEPDEFVEVCHQPDNIGIDSGLRIALAWAADAGYDLLWTFDQDSVPTPDCLDKLLTVYRSRVGERLGIIAPQPVDSRSGQRVHGADFHRDHFAACRQFDPEQPYPCDAPITSGSLIVLAAARKAPPPRTDLFIDGVDWDYGMRLRQAGFVNLIVPQALLEHRFGEPQLTRLLGRSYVFQRYSPLRYYYICRNHTFLGLHYAQGWRKLTAVLQRLAALALLCALIGRFEPEDKLKKTRACLRGTWHGLWGRLGKRY